MRLTRILVCDNSLYEITWDLPCFPSGFRFRHADFMQRNTFLVVPGPTTASADVFRPVLLRGQSAEDPIIGSSEGDEPDTCCS